MLRKLYFIALFISGSSLIQCGVVNMTDLYKQLMEQNKCSLPKKLQSPNFGDENELFFGIPLSSCNSVIQTNEDGLSSLLCHEMFENLLKILKCGTNDPVFNDEMLKEISYDNEENICGKFHGSGMLPQTMFAILLQKQESCNEICSIHKKSCRFLLWAYQVRSAIHSDSLDEHHQPVVPAVSSDLPATIPKTVKKNAEYGTYTVPSEKTSVPKITSKYMPDSNKNYIPQKKSELHDSELSGKNDSNPSIISPTSSIEESVFLAATTKADKYKNNGNYGKNEDLLQNSASTKSDAYSRSIEPTSSEINKENKNEVMKKTEEIPTSVSKADDIEDIQSPDNELQETAISKMSDKDTENLSDISSNSEASSDGSFDKASIPEPNSPDFNSLTIDNGIPFADNSHFFLYFMIVVGISAGCYMLFHNKQKIIALIVEGRHERRRRHNGASYRKLEAKT